MLSVRDLRAGYGAAPVLVDVSIDVPAGRIVSVLGANGAGKTTLLRSISGMTEVSGGSVMLDDEPITGRPPEAIRKLGLVHCPEGRGLFPKLSVRENLLTGLIGRREHSGGKRDLEKMLAFFPRLREREKLMAGNLSGGEQQMLAIARAWIGEPKVLLLDEPSMGLSPILTTSVMELVTEIRKEGVTIVLVEQNASAALRIADEAYVLVLGAVAFSGTAKEVRTSGSMKSLYLGKDR